MYVCRECEKPINQASELCPYCGADLTVAPSAESPEPRKPRSRTKMILSWGVVLAFFGAIFWFSLPLRQANPAPQAEARALDALGQINAALRSYNGLEGNFPASLEVLGEPVREAARSAQSAGYDLNYMPTIPDSDGRVRHYVLLARPGNYGYRGFYTDESGTLHATRENRPATAQDPSP